MQENSIYKVTTDKDPMVVLTELFSQFSPDHPFIRAAKLISDEARTAEMVKYFTLDAVDGHVSASQFHDKLNTLELSKSVPAKNSFLNAENPLPPYFMQHENLFVLGINAEDKIRSQPEVWWTPVTHEPLKQALDQLLDVLTATDDELKINFCSYKL